VPCRGDAGLRGVYRASTLSQTRAESLSTRHFAVETSCFMLDSRSRPHRDVGGVTVDARSDPRDRILARARTMGRIRGTRNWELVWVWHSCVGGPPVLFAKVHQDRKDFISTVLSYRRRVQKDYTRRFESRSS
jgi:hypothetical protein